MLERRRALGYVEAQLTGDSLWGGAGSVARGHEFHYSELAGDPAGAGGWKSVYRLTRARGGDAGNEGFTNGTVLASYAHLHFASRPMARRYRAARLTREGCDGVFLNLAGNIEERVMRKESGGSTRPRIHMVIEGRQVEAIEAASQATTPKRRGTVSRWAVARAADDSRLGGPLAGKHAFSAGAVAPGRGAAGRPPGVDSNMIRRGPAVAPGSRYGPRSSATRGPDGPGGARVVCRDVFAVRKARDARRRHRGSARARRCWNSTDDRRGGGAAGVRRRAFRRLRACRRKQGERWDRRPTSRRAAKGGSRRRRPCALLPRRRNDAGEGSGKRRRGRDTSRRILLGHGSRVEKAGGDMAVAAIPKGGTASRWSNTASTVASPTSETLAQPQRRRGLCW
jgi:hypothetical protein